MEWYAAELERKHVLSILWNVKCNPGMTKTDIVRMERGGEKTKYDVLTKLIELNLIRSDGSSGKSWNSEHLYLTEAGNKIAEHIEAINGIMADLYSADDIHSEHESPDTQ